MIHLMIFLIAGYFNLVEKQAAYLQHQFDRPQKRTCCLLLLAFPENMSYCFVLALEIQDFLQGLLPP